jgi:DNA topoisomerase-3
LVSESARDDASYARVSMSTEAETSKPPPCGLNTVDLLKSCSAGMGMGAHRVMQIAERLYIDGRISYPRTESSAFPKGFDFRETLSACVCHPDLGDAMVAEMLAEADSSSAEANVARRETRNAEQPAFRAPRGGVDAGDHPPITPAGISASSPADVGGVDAWRVYDFIVRRFVAACARDCVCVTRAIALEVGGELFDACASETKQPGWTDAMPWRAPRETRFARAFVVGDATPVANVELAADVTSPPNAMTESELISLMEQHGIGTDASIPTHINNVEKRKYVSIDQKTRRVDVSDLGFVLVAGYDAVDPELASPFTRKAVENQLDLIATGKADHAEVVRHALEQFALKYAHFVKNVDAVDSLFELKFDPSARASLAEAPPFSKCGRCARFLRLSQTRARKVLHCVTENETYALPHGAEVTPWDGRSCPLCDFELLLCSFGPGPNDKARFPLCVRCFKTKPVSVCGGVDRKPRLPFACPHPSAHPIVEERLVCPCPTCDDALMVEPRRNSSRKKTSRLRCASCETTLRLPPSVASASPTRLVCGGCGARCVEVRFDTEKTPLAGGKTTLVACVACEDALRNDAVLLQKLPGRGADDGRRGGFGGGRGGGGGRL